MSIIIYSTTACPYCNMAKAYLKEKGVEFQEFDVSQNQEKGLEMVEKSGQQGVPVIDVNGKIIIGFDKAKIDEALANEG